MNESMAMSIDEWHARLVAHADGGIDPAMPRLPARAIQEQFVGSALRPAFEEAYTFYATFVNYAAALAMPFDAPNARFLDFGCGWGRFLRYAMNQFPRDRLFATDIDAGIVASCIETGIPAQYSVIDPLGKLPFADDFFSHAMAYSVFTHLPENVHLNWSAEIIRVLKPGGVFCGTIETRKFLEFIQNMPQAEHYTNDWERSLASYKPQVEQLMAAYDRGNFVYLPTGGGGVRTSDVYGEAVIAPNYIEAHWQGATLRAVLDEGFWQTVIIVQKH
jgi:SAM-dependent methyltransferase